MRELYINWRVSGYERIVHKLGVSGYERIAR